MNDLFPLCCFKAGLNDHGNEEWIFKGDRPGLGLLQPGGMAGQGGVTALMWGTNH